MHSSIANLQQAVFENTDPKFNTFSRSFNTNIIDNNTLHQNKKISKKLTNKIKTNTKGLTEGFETPRSGKSYLSKENTDKMKKDLNRYCLECHEKDPEWCSVNNGIFICL